MSDHLLGSDRDTPLPSVAAPRSSVRALLLGPPDLLMTSVEVGLSAAGIETRRLDSRTDRPGSAMFARPGLVVLVDVGELDPGAVIDLAQRHDATVLALAPDSATERAAAAVAAGAQSWIRTSTPLGGVVQAVREAAAGRSGMSPASRASLSALHHDGLEALEADIRRLDRLTRREREVLDLLVAGHRPAQAATAMVVAMPTVRTHIRHILRKLGVNSVQQATEFDRDVSRRRALLAPAPRTGRGRLPTRSAPDPR